ncbi:MAG: Rho termination factor N-terminal domain-containing protein, partial [Parachlamydiaceae bacterium]|nr:Rho termination factor N-terminal domain-containing protein [Parachlamydiaceae bacterium]
MDPENDYSEPVESTLTDSPQSNKTYSRAPNSSTQAPAGSLEQHPKAEEIVKIADIQRMDIDQLNLYAKQIGLKHLGSLTKSQVVFEIVKAISENPNEVLYGEGVLEILPDGFGFLRSPNYNYLPSAEDIYVSPA